MNRSEIKYQQAKQRMDSLWDYYNKNNMLLMADVENITGVKWRTAYDTLARNGMDGPPIYDTTESKVKRKAERLKAEAQRLGRDWLTEDEASKVVSVRPSRLPGVLSQIKKRGFTHPHIQESEIVRIVSGDGYDEDINPRFNGRINYQHHPAGLQVLNYWIGPTDDQVTYLLR